MTAAACLCCLQVIGSSPMTTNNGPTQVAPLETDVTRPTRGPTATLTAYLHTTAHAGKDIARKPPRTRTTLFGGRVRRRPDVE